MLRFVMVGSLVQRQIERLLDEAEAAFEARDWMRLMQLARDAPSLDPEHAGGRFGEAREIFEQVALSEDFVDFLTLSAYERLD